MDRRRVLVFPGSTEIGLEIWRALKFCKDVELFSAASHGSSHATYAFKNHYEVPDVVTGDWLGPLNDCIGKYKIDYVYPANDDVLLALASSRDKVAAKVVASPAASCEIARFKSRTYELLGPVVHVPRVYTDASAVTAYPVFVKPDRGAGSQGASLAHDVDELRALTKAKGKLIMEYLPGKEYTIDCFVDRRKGLLFCAGRERIRIKSGIAMNSRPVPEELNDRFRGMAERILSKLTIHGAWFFQAREDSSGDLTLLEIAPRISGTMATFRVLGINFPLLSMYEMEGRDIEIMTNDIEIEIDRRLENRYRTDLSFSTVYVDLDDTLIINGSVNTQLVTFLYQCINRGDRIVLISKSRGDLQGLLDRSRLRGIFDDVIWLREGEEKADSIDPEGAIFIDDSFGERRAVAERHGIPTFSCDMVEALLDDRV